MLPSKRWKRTTRSYLTQYVLVELFLIMANVVVASTQQRSFLQDGLSFSGEFLHDPERPFFHPDGTLVSYSAFDKWPQGIKYGSNGDHDETQFHAGVTFGDYLWTVTYRSKPLTNYSIIRINKQNGSMTAFNDFPTDHLYVGDTEGTGRHLYGMAVAGSFVYFSPARARGILRLDPATSAMRSFDQGLESLSLSESFPTWCCIDFKGIIYDGIGRLWLQSNRFKEIVSFNLATEKYEAHSPPFNLNLGDADLTYYGIVRTEDSIWLTPQIKTSGFWTLSLQPQSLYASKVIDAYNVINVPSIGVYSTSGWGIGVWIACGAVDHRQRVICAPWKFINVVLAVDINERYTTFGNWPDGVVIPSIASVRGAFTSPVFDGKYVWLTPCLESMSLVRLDTETGAMVKLDGYRKLPAYRSDWGFRGMVFDPEVPCLWMLPGIDTTAIVQVKSLFSATEAMTESRAVTESVKKGLSKTETSYSQQRTRSAHFSGYSKQPTASAIVSKGLLSPQETEQLLETKSEVRASPSNHRARTSTVGLEKSVSRTPSSGEKSKSYEIPVDDSGVEVDLSSQYPGGSMISSVKSESSSVSSESSRQKLVEDPQISSIRQASQVNSDAGPFPPWLIPVLALLLIVVLVSVAGVIVCRRRMANRKLGNSSDNDFPTEVEPRNTTRDDDEFDAMTSVCRDTKSSLRSSSSHRKGGDRSHTFSSTNSWAGATAATFSSQLAATPGTSGGSSQLIKRIHTSDGDDFGTAEGELFMSELNPLTLNQFKKSRLLGSGGFGRVFAGYDLRSGGLAAVKEVTLSVIGASIDSSQGVEDDERPEVNVDVLTGGLGAQKRVRSLEREIAMLQRFRHPNIVSYYGCDRSTDCFFIFMEYLPGGSLRDLLDSNYSAKKRQDGPRMSLAMIVNFTRQILWGLAYLHSQRVVHRDIKSDNILLDEDGGLKLADFGCARTVESMTSLHGTPLWMAPEAIRSGTDLSTASDVWAVGCVIIELATSLLPFHWIGKSYTVMSVVALGGPKLDAALEALPDAIKQYPDLHHFVLRCLQHDPEQRPSVVELLEDPLFERRLGVGGERSVPAATIDRSSAMSNGPDRRNSKKEGSGQVSDKAVEIVV